LHGYFFKPGTQGIGAKVNMKISKLKLDGIQGKEFQPLDCGKMNFLKGGDKPPVKTFDTLTVTPSGNSWDGKDDCACD